MYTYMYMYIYIHIMYVKQKYMLQYSWNTHTGTEGNIKDSAPCVYINSIYVYIYIRTYIYFTHTGTEGNVKGSTPALLSLLFGRHGRACVGEDRYHHADVACVCVCVDRRMRENCQRNLSTQKETSNKDISTKKNS